MERPPVTRQLAWSPAAWKLRQFHGVHARACAGTRKPGSPRLGLWKAKQRDYAGLRVDGIPVGERPDPGGPEPGHRMDPRHVWQRPAWQRHVWQRGAGPRREGTSDTTHKRATSRGRPPGWADPPGDLGYQACLRRPAKTSLRFPPAI